jgi:AcrR family transcriptional regulator
MPMINKGKQPSKRKPGQRAGLTMDEILKAAAELIEKTQLDGFSLRRLAQVLEVHPRAIQVRFKGGFDTLLPPLAAYLLAQVARPLTPEDTAVSYLRDIFRRMLDTFHGRPALARIVARMLADNELLVPPLAERILVALRAGGLSRNERMDALHMVLGTLIGLLALEAGNSIGGKIDAKAALIGIEKLPKTEYPELKAGAQILATRMVERNHKNLSVADRYANLVISSLKLVPQKKGALPSLAATEHIG